ncbi:MAG: DUF2723 domain-containing protein [Polyangia bacterium]
MGKRRSAPRKGTHAAADGAKGVDAAAASQSATRLRLAPFLVFLALAALYIATLNPSVAGGDSGEITAAALTGGVPHPSGYPLFAMLARFFAALPLGHSPAWRVNLLSALSTAAAGGLVCAVVQSWIRNTWAGILAAALFGANSLVWSHATSAEVFGLNAMFVALVFTLWLWVERTLSRRAVFALVFASGLGMCNHHSLVFVAAPLVIRSLWVARRNLGATGVAMACALGLLGLAPYLYLMSASTSAAAVSWGDESSIAGLVAHILRRDYGTFGMGRAGAQTVFVAHGTFFPTLWRMWGYAFPRLLWFGPVLAVTGFYLGVKNRPTRTTTVMLLLVLCFYSLTFSALSNLSTPRPHLLAVLGRFCIESDLLLAIAAGVGFAGLLQRLGARVSWPRLAPVAVVAAFALGVALHAGQASGRHNTVYRDFVTTAFASLPANALVITAMGDDVTGAVFYFQEVEQLRTDVVHLDSDYLAMSWYMARRRRLHPDVYLPQGAHGSGGWTLKQLLDGNPHRPVVVIGHVDDWDTSWQDGYKLVTYGLLRWLVRPAEFPTYEEWVERDRQAIGTYDIAPALRAPDESWENGLGRRVIDSQVGRAHLALVYSDERGGALEPARYALRILEEVVAQSGGDGELGIAAAPEMRKIEPGAALWKNLGLAYQVLARSDGRYAARLAIACARFVQRARADDPDLPAARKYLDEMRAPQRDAVLNTQRISP